LQNSPTFNRGGQASTHQRINSAGSKPVQKAGGSYDDKLAEMITTTIVDRSPAVKWDDVGMLLIIYHLYSSKTTGTVSLISNLICSWSRQGKASTHGNGYFAN
jgi:hypothetical protein